VRYGDCWRRPSTGKLISGQNAGDLAALAVWSKDKETEAEEEATGDVSRLQSPLPVQKVTDTE